MKAKSTPVCQTVHGSPDWYFNESYGCIQAKSDAVCVTVRGIGYTYNSSQSKCVSSSTSSNAPQTTKDCQIANSDPDMYYNQSYGCVKAKSDVVCESVRGAGYKYDSAQSKCVPSSAPVTKCQTDAECDGGKQEVYCDRTEGNESKLTRKVDKFSPIPIL